MHSVYLFWYTLRVAKTRKIRGLEDRLITKMTEMQYTVIFEKDVNSYGTYVSDLPGCVAIGETMEEVRRLIAEAIQFHIEGLQEDGSAVPLPSSTAAFIDVATI